MVKTSLRLISGEQLEKKTWRSRDNCGTDENQLCLSWSNPKDERQKVKEESKVLKDLTAMIHLPFEFYALKFIYNRFLDENNPEPIKEFSAHRIE